MAIRPTQELIIDRTSNDVQMNNAKGNYNVSDFNRILEWQFYIKDLLNENGYYVKPLESLPPLSITYIPRMNDMRIVKDNLTKLKEAYITFQSTPQVPSTERNFVTYTDANDIEKIMVDIEKVIEYLLSYYVYSGVANSGDYYMWQQRFRRTRTFSAIPFRTFNEAYDNVLISNIANQNDEMEYGISRLNGVYGTILFINNKSNELDNLIGGIYDN